MAMEVTYAFIMVHANILEDFIIAIWMMEIDA
jgi:hypothetical protein